MTKSQGLAAIPLLFGLLLLVAIPLTLSQVKQNQNTQNRAASYTCLNLGEANCFQTPCCDGLTCDQGTCQGSAPVPTRPASNQIPCSEINNLIATYCQNPGSSPPSGFIRCQELISLKNNYCQTTPTSTPIPRPPTSTSIPRPTRNLIPSAAIPTTNLR